MNDKKFLISVYRELEEKGIWVWIFGGWAQELLELIAPRAHGDLDFLYPAKDFSLLEHWAQGRPDMREVLPKHFLHKRAYEIHGILVEFTLVTELQTNFFGAYLYTWPDDTFQNQGTLRIVSPSALREYIQTYHEHSYGRAVREGLVG